MTTIAPDDPRAGNMVYVAVCRACSGWTYISSTSHSDNPDMKRDNKRAAAWCVDHNADFRLMRFGDVNLTTCECWDKKRKQPLPKQEALAI